MDTQTPAGEGRAAAGEIAVAALPALVWMAVILVMSGDAGSASHSAEWLAVLLRALGMGDTLSPGALQALNVGLRKTGHLLAYLLLAVLLARVARRAGGRFGAGAAATAWAGAVAWASVDETRQSIHSSRGGSPADVSLDALGAALGLFLYAAWLHCRSRRR